MFGCIYCNWAGLIPETGDDDSWPRCPVCDEIVSGVRDEPKPIVVEATEPDDVVKTALCRAVLENLPNY